MQTTGARKRLRRAGAEGDGKAKPSSLPDRLTADIDDELDAELFAAASTVGSPEAEPAAALVRTGELADTDAALLLGRAFQEVWSGQLVIRGAEAEKSIYLDAGRPVHAISTAVEDRLGEMLLRQGRLDASQRTRVARMSAESGRRTGAVLVDLGLIKPGELMPALRSQQEEIILSVLPWAEGRYRFDPRVEPDPRKARLLRHPGVLVAEALRRGLPEARVRRYLGPGRTVFGAAGGPEAQDLLAELSPEDGARELFGWFDGIRSLDEVSRASGLTEERVLRAAFVLRCFGLLTPVATPRGRGRRSFDQRVDRERILARFALAQDADYFQILGIDREASAAEAARAYRRLADEISPQRVDPEVAATLARELQLVRDVLGEAQRVLTDETLRRRYREHLLPPAGRRS